MSPYPLKGLSITKPNHVWATDITYIRLNNGFVYLVAIMDWFSRYVLSWELSNSLDVFFLERALGKASPLIFNNDQGSQFTSEAFTARLESSDIAISWNGRGRYFDNIFVERLWRSVKYEEVYLNDYDSMDAARRRLRDYFNFYNRERFHQSLDYRTPASERIASAVEIPTRCISHNFRRLSLTRLSRISLLKSCHLLSKGWG